MQIIKTSFIFELLDISKLIKHFYEFLGSFVSFSFSYFFFFFIFSLFLLFYILFYVKNPWLDDNDIVVEEKKTRGFFFFFFFSIIFGSNSSSDSSNSRGVDDNDDYVIRENSKEDKSRKRNKKILKLFMKYSHFIFLTYTFQKVYIAYTEMFKFFCFGLSLQSSFKAFYDEFINGQTVHDYRRSTSDRVIPIVIRFCVTYIHYLFFYKTINLPYHCRTSFRKFFEDIQRLSKEADNETNDQETNAVEEERTDEKS